MAAVALPEAERPNAEAAREVSAKMTKARCKAMVRELLSAYAAKSFQTKLTEILNKEVENKTVITDELAARWAWAEKVHNDILAQYGFATGHGMEYLTLPLELILKSCPECMANVQKISEFLKLKTWPISETEKEEAKAAPQGLVAGRELSKPRALALQTELLAILSTPGFQKKLAEMSRKKLPHDTLHEYNRVSWLHAGQTLCVWYDLMVTDVPAFLSMVASNEHCFQDAICKLFDDAQMETIARPGQDSWQTFVLMTRILFFHAAAGMDLTLPKRVWRTLAQVIFDVVGESKRKTTQHSKYIRNDWRGNLLDILLFLDADLLMLFCQDMFEALEKLHEVDCWQSFFWCWFPTQGISVSPLSFSLAALLWFVMPTNAKQYLYTPNFAKTRTLTFLSMPLRSKKPCWCMRTMASGHCHARRPRFVNHNFSLFWCTRVLFFKASQGLQWRRRRSWRQTKNKVHCCLAVCGTGLFWVTVSNLHFQQSFAPCCSCLLFALFLLGCWAGWYAPCALLFKIGTEIDHHSMLTSLETRNKHRECGGGPKRGWQMPNENRTNCQDKHVFSIVYVERLWPSKLIPTSAIHRHLHGEVAKLLRKQLAGFSGLTAW